MELSNPRELASWFSRLKIHPPPQVLEARVVAEGVDSQILLRDATKCL